MNKVIAFNEDNFAEALSNSHTPVSVIKDKNHFVYLMHYLRDEDVNAQCLIIEDGYISKDYLHDYTEYYATCFETYNKVCKRIHLFDKMVTDEEFQHILISKDNKEVDSFWAHYLGYIVVKPIPITVIGYTVLKTYKHDGEFKSRNYWAVKDYIVHIFGTRRVISSLAFQEQDKVVAACATTAIWSLLHKAFRDKSGAVKSPSEITHDAGNLSHDGSRLFPNKGLEVSQICQAIMKSGLDCEVQAPGQGVSFLTNDYLKELTQAYSQVGIPIILIIKISSEQDLHAVTVVGHSHPGAKIYKPRKTVRWLSENIDKLYVHDDQWGPFARVQFRDKDELVTPWNELRNKEDKVWVVNVVVSVQPKVRISYDDIKKLVTSVNGIFNLVVKNVDRGYSWDIRLCFSEKYKQEVKEQDLSSREILDIITSKMPKFVWVATCYSGTERLLDLVFDATGVLSAMLGLRVVIYFNKFKGGLHDFLLNNEKLVLDLLECPGAAAYREWLIAQTTPSTSQ